MECRCREDLEQRLTDRYKELYPNSEDHSAILQGYSMIFSGNKIVTKPAMEVVIKHKALVKKSGLLKEKKEKTNMIFSYCPFCGVKIED